MSVLAHGATRLCARWWRAPAAPLASLTAPEGRGCAPLPPDPYPRQAELAGFCALRARAALRAGVSVLAHVATLMFVLTHGAAGLTARWWCASYHCMTSTRGHKFPIPKNLLAL